MLSYLVRKRIQNRSKDWNIPIPSNYRTNLNQYTHLNILNGNRLVYSWAYDSGSKVINATALLHKIILVNAEWAARLALIEDQDTKDAFMITIGHELTHKEKDFFSFRYILSYKFISWVNEVHADFGAAEKMADSSRDKLILSMKYKLSLKQTDNDSPTHPSWKRRLKYASNYDFDETLIRKIADDIGCHNEFLINKITSYYKPIILK